MSKNGVFEMPLDKSGSRSSIGINVRTEMDAGKKRSQALAIALSTARKAGAHIKRKSKSLTKHVRGVY